VKELDEHCCSLSRLVSGYDIELEWLTQSEWLNIASGIVSVKFDIMRYDSSVGYCRNADNWHFSREEILEKYVTELTGFTYVWGALEALINEIDPPPAPIKGRIRDICYYLYNKLDSGDVIDPYPSVVERLRQILETSDARDDRILKRFDKIENISEHGTGIYAIYKLRNSLVHGSIAFPYPDEENRPISMYPELVRLSTRIVLLTMQMIWLAHYKGSKVLCSVDWETLTEKKYPIEEVLHKIHLKNIVYSVA